MSATADGNAELVGLEWRRFGQHVILTFTEGGHDRINGDRTFATAMAEDAGLVIVESSPTGAHWVKNPSEPTHERVPVP